MKKVEIYLGETLIKSVNCNKIQKDPDTNCNYLFIHNSEKPNFEKLVCIVPYNYLLIIVS